MRRHRLAVLMIVAGLAAGWLAPRTIGGSHLPALAGPIYTAVAGANLRAVESAVATHDAYSLAPESTSRLAANLGGKLAVSAAPSTGPMALSVAYAGGYVGLAVLGGRCKAALVSPQGHPAAVRGLSDANCSGTAALVRAGR